MENNKDLQELDDMLSELHDLVLEEVPDVEPDEELQELLDLPEITVTPVVVKEIPIREDAVSDEALPESPSETFPEEALDGSTVLFTPLTEESIDREEPESEESATEDTVRIPDPDPEPTQRIPAAAEPAFEVEEEFKPSPILFTTRSKLKELKKELVAGPEKRYYELSEIGTGRLQMALLLNVIVVLICAAVTTMFAMNMVPENRLRLVIFSQVLAMMVSALLGSHLMIDAIADLFKGRFTVNTLLTVTFAACMVDGIFCLMDLRVPCCAAFSLEMTMALWARLQKRNTEMAQLDTLRKAVRLHGIVKVDDFYNGKDGLLRKEGHVSDFMDIYEKPSTPEVIQSIYAALSLLVCIGIAGFAGALHGFSMAVQIFSTSLLVAVPASFFVSISRPMPQQRTSFGPC